MSRYTANIDGKTVEYIVKERVGFEECVDAYHKIVECLFPDVPDMDKEGNITAFAPYMHDLAEAYAFVTLFTDISLDGVDNEEIWKLWLDGEVLDRINSYPLNERAITIIRRWVAQFVDDYKNRILAHQKSDELYDAITMFVNGQNNESIDTKALGDIISKFEGMTPESIIKTVVREQSEE